MNRLLGYILCPVHTDSDPSCAVYSTEREDMVRLYCYGCTHAARVPASTTLPLLQDKRSGWKGFRSIPVSLSYKLTPRVCEFLASRNITLDVARQYQIQAGNELLYMPAFDVNGLSTSGQVRYLSSDAPQKIASVCSAGSHMYPSCAWYKRTWLPEKKKKKKRYDYYIVESQVDAMSLLSQQVTDRAVALLGTTIKPQTRQDLMLEPIKRLFIYFDPDATGRRSAMDLYRDLSRLFEVVVIESNKKPYETDGAGLPVLYEEEPINEQE